MKNCQNCGKQISDAYTLCIDCNAKIKQSQGSDELVKKLDHINWNLGALTKLFKFYVYHKFRNEGVVGEVESAIFEELTRNIQKDLQQYKDIDEIRDGGD